jgi:hypothetical protein
MLNMLFKGIPSLPIFLLVQFSYGKKLKKGFIVDLSDCIQLYFKIVVGKITDLFHFKS